MPKAIKHRFYVYVLRDPRPDKNLHPIYVGKGNGRRAQTHWNQSHKHSNPLLRRVLGKIRKANLEPLLNIIDYFDNEFDAYQREIELIAAYGRRDRGDGLLCNLTDGGEGNSDGFRENWNDPAFREAHVERLRKLNTDPKVIKDKSERMKALHANPEFKEANAIRSRARMNELNADPSRKKEAADRMRKMNTSSIASERSLERWADPEFKARASASMKAAWNDRRRTTIAEQSRERWSTPEYRAKMSAVLEATKPKRSAALKATHAKNPERRMAIAKEARERWNNPELRSRMLRATPEQAKIMRAALAIKHRQSMGK